MFQESHPPTEVKPIPLGSPVSGLCNTKTDISNTMAFNFEFVIFGAALLNKASASPVPRSGGGGPSPARIVFGMLLLLLLLLEKKTLFHIVNIQRIS